MQTPSGRPCSTSSCHGGQGRHMTGHMGWLTLPASSLGQPTWVWWWTFKLRCDKPGLTFIQVTKSKGVFFTWLSASGRRSLNVDSQASTTKILQGESSSEVMLFVMMMMMVIILYQDLWACLWQFLFVLQIILRRPLNSFGWKCPWCSLNHARSSCFGHRRRWRWSSSSTCSWCLWWSHEPSRRSCASLQVCTQECNILYFHRLSFTS